MLEILDFRFFRGPNLYFPSSGVFLTINSGDGDPGGFDSNPDQQDVRVVLEYLHGIFPAVAGSSQLASPGYVCQSQVPAMALFLAMAEITLRDFSSRPATGVLLGAEEMPFHLFVPCDEATMGQAACDLSLDVVNSIPGIKAGNRQLDSHFRAASKKVRSHISRFGLNQSTMALVRAAGQQGIPHSRLMTPGQLVQLGQGIYRKRIIETMTDNASGVGMLMQKDKFTTSQLLMQHGLPTAGTRPVSSAGQIPEAVQELGFPLVVKPRTAGQGKGVTTNITSRAGLDSALRTAARHNAGIIIERFVEGEDHRLLVVDGHLVAAAKRLPAAVVGDGKRSVTALVEKVNLDPQRGEGFENILQIIEIDQEALDYLEQAGLTPESIPADGQQVVLRGTANLHRGGTAVDVTDDVHPDNRLMVERAARLVGLDVAGIDFYTPDIRQSWRDIPCAILEVNATPGLRPHFAASPQRDVAGAIVRQLFPQGSDGRVPTVAVSGEAGRPDTCRMIAAMLTAAGKKVALSAQQGAWIGEERLNAGDDSGGARARLLLHDCSVEAGVFELAPESLAANGMTLDGVEIGVLLDVPESPPGADADNVSDERVHAGRLVVKHARKLAVLNADEPLCLAARDSVSESRICLVSVCSDNPAVSSHQLKGGLTAFVEAAGSQMAFQLWDGERCIGSVAAECSEDRFLSVLSAMAVAHELGISLDTIAGVASRV